MSGSGISGSFSSQKGEVFVDLGNPFLNVTVDGFLKIGAVGLAKVAAEETYGVLTRGSTSGNNFEHSLKKVFREGASWGAIAGAYVGTEYGIERIRGTRDWKNAAISGALTGALVSAAGNNTRDNIVLNAIAGGALATAAEFISYLT